MTIYTFWWKGYFNGKLLLNFCIPGEFHLSFLCNSKEQNKTKPNTQHILYVSSYRFNSIRPTPVKEAFLWTDAPLEAAQEALHSPESQDASEQLPAASRSSVESLSSVAQAPAVAPLAPPTQRAAPAAVSTATPPGWEVTQKIVSCTYKPVQIVVKKASEDLSVTVIVKIKLLVVRLDALESSFNAGKYLIVPPLCYS